MGCPFLLQGTFLTQGSNLGLPHWGQTLPSELEHFKCQVHREIGGLRGSPFLSVRRLQVVLILVDSGFLTRRAWPASLLWSACPPVVRLVPPMGSTTSPPLAYHFSWPLPLPPWAKPQPCLSACHNSLLTGIPSSSVPWVHSPCGREWSYKNTSQILCSKSFLLEVKIEVFTGSSEALYTDLPLTLISPPPVLTLGSKTALLAVLQPNQACLCVRTLNLLFPLPQTLFLPYFTFLCSACHTCCTCILLFFIVFLLLLEHALHERSDCCLLRLS